jgi:NADPH:quinone reductase-like Zn-dependent oxidoreductase
MPSSTMKAVRLHAHGGPEVLVYEEIARPEPGPGDVLIRVHAACLNPPDWYTRAGFPQIPEAKRPTVALPHTPGSDVSGVIEALGEGVTDWQVGDAVFGLVRFPDMNNGGKGYAEYTTSPAAHLARKPANVDHVHAAAVPMAGLTAWQYLFDFGHDAKQPQGVARLFQDRPWIPAPLGPGRVVLINGAAGGVGHFAAQLAKATGAQVIGVASGRHEAFLRDLGVDEVIDYTKTAVDEVVRDVDLVIDTVGGPLGHRFLEVVKRGGMICPVFFGEYHRERAADLEITVQSGQVRSDGGHMAELARRLGDGTLRAGIDSVFPLREASSAHARAERGHIQGKIVLAVA